MSTALSHHSRDEIVQLGEDIAELATHIDAAMYRLLTMIRRFDEQLGWDPSAFASCAHWLAWSCGLRLGAAREKVRVARALVSLPEIADALRRGEMSYSKVRAMTRVATPESEELLLRQARKMTASQLERLVRHWRVVTGDEETQTARHQDAIRSFSMWPDDDGMVRIRATLTREQAAVFTKALEIAEDLLYKKNPDASDPMSDQFVDKEQRQADALALVAEKSLRDTTGGGAGDRFQVVVHVDEAVLAEPKADGQSLIEGAGRVSAETSRRLACDASKLTMTHDSDGNVLDVGRKTRVVPTALQRAVVYRDRHCQFPGCQNKFCDLHHVKHWAEGGETSISNLLLLCKRHHHAVHEGGYRVERRGDELRFITPWGPVLQTPPPRSDVSAERLANDNRNEGLEIDPTTSGSLSTGEPCDMGWIVDVLRHNYELDRDEGDTPAEAPPGAGD